MAKDFDPSVFMRQIQKALTSEPQLTDLSQQEALGFVGSARKAAGSFAKWLNKIRQAVLQQKTKDGVTRVYRNALKGFSRDVKAMQYTKATKDRLINRFTGIAKSSSVGTGFGAKVVPPASTAGIADKVRRVISGQIPPVNPSVIPVDKLPVAPLAASTGIPVTGPTGGSVPVPVQGAAAAEPALVGARSPGVQAFDKAIGPGVTSPTGGGMPFPASRPPASGGAGAAAATGTATAPPTGTATAPPPGAAVATVGSRLRDWWRGAPKLDPKTGGALLDKAGNPVSKLLSPKGLAPYAIPAMLMYALSFAKDWTMQSAQTEGQTALGVQQAQAQGEAQRGGISDRISQFLMQSETARAPAAHQNAAQAALQRATTGVDLMDLFGGEPEEAPDFRTSVL